MVEPPVLGVIRHEHRNADERKDSIELGPAHARIKVYMDVSVADTKAVIDLALEASRYAVEEQQRLGLLKKVGP